MTPYTDEEREAAVYITDEWDLFGKDYWRVVHLQMELTRLKKRKREAAELSDERKDAEIAALNGRVQREYTMVEQVKTERDALKVELESLKQELGRHINRTLRDLQTISEVGY